MYVLEMKSQDEFIQLNSNKFTKSQQDKFYPGNCFPLLAFKQKQNQKTRDGKRKRRRSEGDEDILNI